MKTKVLYFLLGFILEIQISGCDIYDGKLIIVNNSKEKIVYKAKFDSLSLDSTDIYNHLSSCTIIPYDTARVIFAMGGKGASEYAINHHSIDSTLHIYIFNLSTLIKVPWDTIMKKKIYFVQHLKVVDLNRIKWVIKFNK